MIASTPVMVDRRSSAELYLRVREAEGRLYSDEIVSRLPEFPSGHPLKQEWLARSDSSQRLLRYLLDLGRPLEVLELGCGNGWLSHRVAGLPGSRVLGLDRAGPELSQAARLFAGPSSAFVVADLTDAPFLPRSFDVILIASAIQYFPDLPALIRLLLGLLKRQGEIHVLDSPLYSAQGLPAARRRSAIYYSELGFPEMAGAYFHHLASALDEFNADYLWRPQGFVAALDRRLGRVTSPFPWIRIRQAS